MQQMKFVSFLIKTESETDVIIKKEDKDEENNFTHDDDYPEENNSNDNDALEEVNENKNENEDRNEEGNEEEVYCHDCEEDPCHWSFGEKPCCYMLPTYQCQTKKTNKQHRFACYNEMHCILNGGCMQSFRQPLANCVELGIKETWPNENNE